MLLKMMRRASGRDRDIFRITASCLSASASDTPAAIRRVRYCLEISATLSVGGSDGSHCRYSCQTRSSDDWADPGLGYPTRTHPTAIEINIWANVRYRASIVPGAVSMKNPP